MPKPTHYGYSRTTIYQPWTLNIALLRHLYELARFLSAADKTPLQRLSYMSCHPPLTLAGFGVFDGAKIQLFFELTKNEILQKGKSCPKTKAPLGGGAGSLLCRYFSTVSLNAVRFRLMPP